MSNLLNTRIGVLGGGQLGKMLVESYSSMNLSYTILEQSQDCPAALVCQNIIEGSLYDEEAIQELAKHSDVLTYEIEHVNVNALERVSKSKAVIPFPRVLEIIQDKGLQKQFYTDNKVSTLDYTICQAKELKQHILNYSEEQFVLKHRKGGYDGRGVQLLSRGEALELIDSGSELMKSEHGYVLEKLCEGAKEISVIVAVGHDRSYLSYEPSEMVFDAKANLMDYLICPAELNTNIKLACTDLAVKAALALDSPGLFAVELFVKDSEVYVNEIAPRPHNSGHHTIESCYTSQYEQLNRILLKMPLGSTKQLTAALTANILGPEDVSGMYFVDGLERVLQIEGVYIHLYGKRDTKAYRKLGHFNVIGINVEECIEKMNTVRKYLRIKAIV